MEKRRSFSNAERESVYKKTGGRCAYCGKEITLSEMQVDHKTPLHNGGTNQDDNLLPACKSCNHYKSTLSIDKFRKALANIPNVLRRDKATFSIAERYGLIQVNYKEVQFYFETLEENN